jgi:cytochrome P450
MASPLAGHQVRQAATGLALPFGPHYPRIIQAWLWLKRPLWFLDHCTRAYGDVFTMRLPLGMNLVHIADPELVKSVFGAGTDVLRAGEANATILEPLMGRHSVLVLDGPEHSRQRKLILPAFHGDRMRAWEETIRGITRAEVARWPTGTSFALRPRMQSITLDVIVRVVFGVDGSARGDELRRRIVAVMRIGRNPFLLMATRGRRLGPYAPWARFMRARDALDVALFAEIGDRRRALDLERRGDVLSQLLLARDEEGRAMTDDEVQIVLPEVLRAVTLRPASPRPARVRRESVTFVPHNGARCVVTGRR